jgi:hypothetical protein
MGFELRAAEWNNYGGKCGDNGKPKNREKWGLKPRKNGKNGFQDRKNSGKRGEKLLTKLFTKPEIWRYLKRCQW